MVDLIKDRNEFEKFRGILPPLPNGYAYLLSLSARNKYLDADERKYYNLGKTEMFGRTLIKDLNDFDFYIRKLASNLTYKRTRSGHPFPEKAMVVYMMINPTNMVSAYYTFQERMNGFLHEMSKAMSNKKTPNLQEAVNMDHHLLTSVGKASRKRDFIDLDLDSKEPSILHQVLKGFGGFEYHVVTTQGGYHILIPKEQKPFPPAHQIIKDVLRENPELKELCFNRNAMIPLPGTLQAGSLVTFTPHPEVS